MRFLILYKTINKINTAGLGTGGKNWIGRIKAELDAFNKKMNSYSKVPDGLKNILAQYPKNSHPMGVLSASVASLSCFYPEYLDQDLLYLQ